MIKRRTKLHKLLKNYGSPVQYSVFEVILSMEEIKQDEKGSAKIVATQNRPFEVLFHMQNLQAEN